MQSLAEHFTTIRVLGEGGFGIVKLVKSRQDGQVCNSPYLGGSVRQCTCGIEKTEICLYAYHLFVAIRRQAFLRQSFHPQDASTNWLGPPAITRVQGISDAASSFAFCACASIIVTKPTYRPFPNLLPIPFYVSVRLHSELEAKVCERRSDREHDEVMQNISYRQNSIWIGMAWCQNRPSIDLPYRPAHATTSHHIT